jgi:hypothetical protein
MKVVVDLAAPTLAGTADGTLSLGNGTEILTKPLRKVANGDMGREEETAHP